MGQADGVGRRRGQFEFCCLLEGSSEGAEFGFDEEPVEHAVAAGAFADSGGGELLLHLLQHRGLRPR